MIGHWWSPGLHVAILAGVAWNLSVVYSSRTANYSRDVELAGRLAVLEQAAKTMATEDHLTHRQREILDRVGLFLDNPEHEALGDPRWFYSANGTEALLIYGSLP